MKHHITVLAKEAVNALLIKPGYTVVDATVGSAGHTSEILSRLDGDGTLIGIDADAAAIEGAKTLQRGGVKTHFQVGNFRSIDRILRDLTIETVDAILADLGWRMEQFSGGGRGFSFSAREPLLMTYGDPANYHFTATDIVNDWNEEDIQNVIKGYGEERFAKRIAKAIVEHRTTHPIATAKELAELIEDTVPSFSKKGKTHPATKTFQALRIAVNDELDALREFIEGSIQHLGQNRRIAIVTFNSLEDRIVKHMFRDLAKQHVGTVITKKPIRPTRDEITANARARSAKLRIFEKNDKE